MIYTRGARFEAQKAMNDTRTIPLVWSTGATVRRRDVMTGKEFDEILSLHPDHVNLSRLIGAPLLDSHQHEGVVGVIGVVEKAWLEDQMARALVRFSRSERAEPIYQDVIDGILRQVSVGYKVNRWQTTAGDDNTPPQKRAVDWVPLEISVVAVGADEGAGFRQYHPWSNPLAEIQQTIQEMRIDLERLQRTVERKNPLFIEQLFQEVNQL